MSYQLIIFPDPLGIPTDLTLDNGYTARGVPAVHPTGRKGVGFDIPVGTPNGNGAMLHFASEGYDGPKTQRGRLLLNDGTLNGFPWTPGQTADFTADDFRFTKRSASGMGAVHIIGDHFEQDGFRWYVKGTDGFCDYAQFLDGQDIRPMLRQSQDLGTNLRRIFGCIKNIRAFDPARYGNSFYARLPEFFALLAEYQQFGEFDVLPDTGYWGKSLAWCQEHWARTCDALAPITNRLVSLTNEYDHGGNLVGSVNDYPRPNIELVSQGSAVSDMPPPRPGWGVREMHVLKPWPKSAMIEDMYFNREGVDVDGTTWGPRTTIYLSECVRFEENNPQTDERLARDLAHASLAYGNGLVMHNEFGKDGRVMGPRVARCVQTAMDVLSRA